MFLLEVSFHSYHFFCCSTGPTPSWWISAPLDQNLPRISSSGYASCIFRNLNSGECFHIILLTFFIAVLRRFDIVWSNLIINSLLNKLIVSIIWKKNVFVCYRFQQQSFPRTWLLISNNQLTYCIILINYCVVYIIYYSVQDTHVWLENI